MNASGMTTFFLGRPILLCLLACLSARVQAVPAFARQTGMPCSGCHTMFPELNSVGRHFKLNGYTLTNTAQISQDASGNQAGVSINAYAPVDAMFQFGFTHLAKSEPDTQNNDVQFPQELSLFYAGRISPRLGAFLQLTYEQAGDGIELDNTDIRYADNAAMGDTPLVYGLTLNNAPGVQDVWNTLPVWGFPWVSSGSAPTPVAAPILGQLGGEVVGAGVFALWNDALYGEATFYRSTPHGQSKPDATSTNTISGAAPYVRLAWQHQADSGRYLMVGLHGLWLERFPVGVTGPQDRYEDAGADLQYEQPLDTNLVVLHALYTHEKQTLDASAAGFEPTLHTVRVDAEYHWGTRLGFTVGYWDTSGDSGDYSATYGYVGSPDNRGWMGVLSFQPWQNTKLSLAYTAYDEFDGLPAGRDASDNDTSYAQFWVAW